MWWVTVSDITFTQCTWIISNHACSLHLSREHLALKFFWRQTKPCSPSKCRRQRQLWEGLFLPSCCILVGFNAAPATKWETHGYASWSWYSHCRNVSISMVPLEVPKAENTDATIASVTPVAATSRLEGLEAVETWSQWGRLRFVIVCNCNGYLLTAEAMFPVK